MIIQACTAKCKESAMLTKTTTLMSSNSRDRRPDECVYVVVFWAYCITVSTDFKMGPAQISTLVL